MDIIIVTGLSGAGKSQAVDCLEDLGYYCIDNMPPALIKSFVGLAVQDRMQIEKTAFVMDIRGGEFFGDLKAALADLNKFGMNYRIMFLEASDTALIRRYKETRRSHPLSAHGTIVDGIEKERKKLKEIRRISDFIIDTSTLKPTQLHEEIRRLLFPPVEGEETPVFTITVESFGYKNGIPLDADMVFDMRFIPNPFYLASMKMLTGNNRKVQEYVMKFPESREFVTRIYGLISYLIPLYLREGKPQLVLAFGCTGGQHRSVTMANEFSRLFSEAGRKVITVHRDL